MAAGNLVFLGMVVLSFVTFMVTLGAGWVYVNWPEWTGRARASVGAD